MTLEGRRIDIYNGRCSQVPLSTVVRDLQVDLAVLVYRVDHQVRVHQLDPEDQGSPAGGTKEPVTSSSLSHVAQRTTNSLLLQEIQLFPSLPSPLWGRGDQLDHLDLHYLVDPAHKLSSQDAHPSPHISQHTHLSALLHISPPTSLNTHISPHYCTSLPPTSLNTHISPLHCTSLNTHLSALLHIPQHTSLNTSLHFTPHLSTHTSLSPTSLNTHLFPLHCTSLPPTSLNTHLSTHISAHPSSTASLEHSDNSLFFPWFHLFLE